MRRCCTFLFFWLLFLTAKAQQGFFVPKDATVHFGGDSSTIFSDVLIKGKVGVDKKAVINFKGMVWENAPDATISDETDSTTGTGGWIRSVGSTAAQKLIAGYNAAAKKGAVFPNLQIANRHGVHLYQSSAKVRNHLSFEQGLVYLDNNIFVVGHNTPGKITGYSKDHFFITGTAPGDGLLLRENIRSSDGLVVFPIGTKKGTYTPAAIQSKTTVGDDFYVTAFAGVKSNLLNGTNLANEGVNTTWQAGRLRNLGRGEAELYLQHPVSDEGRTFAKNRNKAYISQYRNAAWDVGTPQATPAAGTLTTTPATAAGGLNRRTFSITFNQTAYFTKFAMPDSLLTNIIWGAYRLSRTIVAVHWQTKPEINVKYFVVQRRLSNETNFSNVSAVNSQALNGISLGYLNYSINDPNGYVGISYYRLQVFDYKGQSYYTNIVAVTSEMGNKIVLWPNPTQGAFSVLANSPLATSMAIYNALGQKLYSKAITVQNQSVVEVTDHRLPSGVYFVAIHDKEGNVLDGTKLIIQR